MTFPSQPLPGTGFTDDFLSLSDYQMLTGDTALTQAQLDFNLPQAELILASKCEATWRYGQYKETLKIYTNGFVYPSATPIDAQKAINQGDGGFLWNPVEVGGTDVLQAGSPIQGKGIMIGPWGMWDPTIVWGSFYPAQMDVTYWGGWDDTSSDTRGDVWTFKRCLAKMVRYSSQPSFATTGGLEGVHSMSIGGISISGSGLNAMMMMDDGMAADVASLKRANVGGWHI